MSLDRAKDFFRASERSCLSSPLPKPANDSIRAISATLIDQIQGIAEPILRSLSLELFDICFSGHQRGGQLQVFIDKQNGVTLDDCERFSRLLSPALDVDDLVPNNYTLEVSSPGLNRPLRGKADYHRFIGKRVKVKTVVEFGSQKVLVGKLVDFDDETVVLSVGHEEKREIPFEQIAHARLEVEEVAGRNRGGLRK